MAIALNPATQIPSGVNTPDKACVWAITLATNLHPSDALKVSKQSDTQFCYAFSVYELPDASFVFGGAVLIPLNPLWAANGTKLWTNALAVGNDVAIPTNWTTN